MRLLAGELGVSIGQRLCDTVPLGDVLECRDGSSDAPVIRHERAGRDRDPHPVGALRVTDDPTPVVYVFAAKGADRGVFIWWDTRRSVSVVDAVHFRPAVGQGAVGITCRADDVRVLEWLSHINHTETQIRVKAERALLAALDGSCRTPIGGLAEIDGDNICLRGLVAREDGSEMFETERSGYISDAEAMGDDAGRELRSRAGNDLFE